MRLTNDCYTIFIKTKNFNEKYYRDSKGWIKISAKGNKFRATAEQVLNHILPAAAGIKPGVKLIVKHKDIKK